MSDGRGKDKKERKPKPALKPEEPPKKKTEEEKLREEKEKKATRKHKTNAQQL